MRDHPLRALMREQGDMPTTVRLVLRGVTILSIVWQGAWILPDSTLWPWNQDALLPRPFMWLAYLCWIGLIVTTWGPQRIRWRYIVFGRLDIAFLFISAILLFATDDRFAQEAWRPATALVNLAAAMTGLLLTTGSAIEVLAVAIGLEFAVLFMQGSRPGGPDTQDIVLIPAYALCAGVAAIVARRGLIFGAQRVDLVQRDAVEAESRVLGIRLIRQRIARQEQRLHETVLNTLTAIARGGVVVDEALRGRCRDAIGVLRRMRTIDETVPSLDAQNWGSDLEDALAELRDLGMEVSLELEVQGIVPPEVYAACITALREACANVRRHSGASAMSLRVHARAGGSRSRATEVRIRIRDDGRGFDIDATPARFGLPHAIRDPLTELGGSVTVHSEPGGGVSIELDWQSAPLEGRDMALRDLGTSARVFAAPVLTAFTAFGLISLVMTSSDLGTASLAWIALLGYALLSAVIIWSTRTSGIPAWLVLVVCAAAPLVFRMQELSRGDNSAGNWSDWASECIAAMFLVIAAAGRPWWAWLAALVSWLVIQGGFPFELIQPGAAVIYAGALYARSVRHNASRYDRINDQRLEELARADVAEREVGLLSRRYALLAQSGAIALLESIVNGRSDPGTTVVRDMAQEEEHYIRAVMRIGAFEDPVREIAGELVQWSKSRGISVDIDLPSARIDIDDIRDFEQALAVAYSRADGASGARLSARSEGDEVVIRLVIIGCVDCEMVREQIGCAAIVCLGEGDLMVEARYGRQ